MTSSRSTVTVIIFAILAGPFFAASLVARMKSVNGSVCTQDFPNFIDEPACWVIVKVAGLSYSNELMLHFCDWAYTFAPTGDE
jgi:hypothetical protein